jgi:hypothetical protein
MGNYERMGFGGVETCHSISMDDDWGIGNSSVALCNDLARDSRSKLDKCFFGCKGKCELQRGLLRLAPSCSTSESQPPFTNSPSTTLALCPPSEPTHRSLLRVFNPLNHFSIVKMLRTGAVKALQAITRTHVPRQLPAFRSQLSSSYLQSSRIAPAFAVPSIRCYSASAGLTKPEVQGRIMDLLKNFDKVRYQRIEIFSRNILSNNVSGHRCIKGTYLKRVCNTRTCC